MSGHGMYQGISHGRMARLAADLCIYAHTIQGGEDAKANDDLDRRSGLRGLGPICRAAKISRFLEDLARPHVVKDDLDAGYQAMASDQRRECEAREWSEGLIGDMADAAR